ncbi:MAG: serine/threonine protein kinase [Candidatus Brocadiae bacterium]|nr:serine/threonine protein kinase [Candidatus Brocadiia bacterium]
MKEIKKKIDQIWESLVVSSKEKKEDLWEEAEFLDSSASEQIKQKCHEVFPEDKIEEFEHYSILEELGRGRMGIVYKAVHKKDNKLYAIKILPEKVVNDPKAVQRFFQEICIHNSLSHDNIIRLHKIGVCQETVFIVMEYVAGYNLDSFLKSKAPLSENKAFQMLIPILDALVHAHSLGIVHRDIKPANILIEEITQKPKIADFGLAKSTAEGKEDDDAFGTPAYMSPEQIMGYKDIDIRADIYAVGSILYHMLSGNRPYYHLETPKLLLKAKTQEDPQDIEDLAPELHPKTKMMVRQALSRDMKSRYQTPLAFLTEAKETLDLVIRQRSQNRIAPKVVEDLNRTSGCIPYTPKGDNEMLLMTASRYEADPVLETFQHEIHSFSESPVGNLLVEETKSGEKEFEETLLSITKVAGSALKISPALEKRLSDSSMAKDLLKNVSNFLKMENLSSEEKNTLNELKYLLLLRANSITKKSEVIKIINEGSNYLSEKLEEAQDITQSSSFNKRIRKYLEQLTDTILKTYHEVFSEEIRICKDYDEMECYLENYPLGNPSILKQYKNLQIIRDIKELKKKLDQKPKELDKVLDQHLGKKRTVLHDFFKKLNNTRSEENTLWNMVLRAKDLSELVAHLKRFEQKPDFKSIASRIRELVNIFIGVGGQMSLQQLKTSLNFIPQREAGKICQLITRTLKTELEEKIQELLRFEGDTHKRFNSFMILLRNPRYHHNITLYGLEIKELSSKIADLRTNPANPEMDTFKAKLPEQLLNLLYGDIEAEATSRVKNIKNCIIRLDKIKQEAASQKTSQIVKDLLELFKLYAKLNFAKEESIYAIDGIQLARILVQYYNDLNAKDIELPENLRQDIASKLKEIAKAKKK